MDDGKIITTFTVFYDMIENVELNSTYRISVVQLISHRNQIKLRTSHLTQIVDKLIKS